MTSISPEARLAKEKNDASAAYDREKLRLRADRRWRQRVGFISLAVGFTTWFLLTTGFNVISPRWLPSPVDIFEGAVRLVSEGFNNVPLHVHILASLGRTTAGFVLGSLVGIPVGLALGQSRVASAAAFPYIAAIRPIPAIAYIPLVILWFGIGELSKVALIFIAAFLYISLSVADGARAVRVDWLRACRSLGGNWFDTFRHVVFPATLPQIMTALKVGATISWSTVVAAELIAAPAGLGSMVMEAATFYRMTDVYIGIILIGLIGFLLLSTIEFLEKDRALVWNLTGYPVGPYIRKSATKHTTDAPVVRRDPDRGSRPRAPGRPSVSQSKQTRRVTLARSGTGERQ